jgi:AcrR family transcriptional regulator
MPRSREPTRRRILDAAYKLFRTRGYARVSIDDIAGAATITKRTLYRHFESKDVIVADVLEAQSQLALAASRTFTRQPGSSDDLVDGLFADIVTWSGTPRWSGSGFTRLVVELADFPGHPARAIARKHKAMLETHVANQLKRLNVASPVERARQVWLLAEGAMVSMLIHQDTAYVEIAAGAAKELLHRGQTKSAVHKKNAL